MSRRCRSQRRRSSCATSAETSSDQPSAMLKPTTDRVAILACQKVLDYGLKVSRLAVRLAPSASDLSEIVGYQIDGLLASSSGTIDGIQLGLRIRQLHATETGSSRGH